ncbi:hypothetical protein NDA13_004040 [Ustilago tritici]|nr:hypothetical protein NDA13_004040 [Ustilago tritici]
MVEGVLYRMDPNAAAQQ